MPRAAPWTVWVQPCPSLTNPGNTPDARATEPVQAPIRIDNLISVYKHNSELLKKVGNFVLGGEVIAIIGNTGELTDGPHLHFELWYNGNPVNPEDFVSF